MRFYVLLILCLPGLLAAQKKRKVLFLGNSYTYVNNLPQMVADLATANGDTLLFDGNLIGGYSLQNHCADAVSLSKIALGSWDFVVLQAQSQEPSFSPQQVNSQTLPFAIRLDSLIKAANPCATTVFYETWGRKNGDASNCPFYPPICTYSGMQNRLRDTYLLFADTCKAIMAPVGEAWRSSISYSPTLELYQSDQSHPVMEGSYLAASVFYEVLFQKSVLTNTYLSGIASPTAAFLRTIAHDIVVDSINTWNIPKLLPNAAFSYTGSTNTFSFSSDPSVFNQQWQFGDGATSIVSNPVHTYTTSGTYTVILKEFDACKADIAQQVLTASSLNPTGIQQVNKSLIYLLPSVFSNELKIEGAKESQNLSIRIVDLQGRSLRTYVNSLYISCADLPKGIYLACIEWEGQVHWQRICKTEE